MVGTIKVSLTSLSTSETNSFQNAFNDEIILLLLLFPLVFYRQNFYLGLWIFGFLFGSLGVFYLNLSRSLLKSKYIAKVHDQNLLHSMLLKAVFPLPEELQCNICVEIKIWW